MAYVGNTLQVRENIGLLGTVREQLEDLMLIVRDVSRPFLRSFPKDGTGSIRYDWPADDLDFDYSIAALLTGSQTEGQDADFKIEDPPVRLWGICQINAESWDTSGTQRAMIKAGREDDFGYTRWKKAHKMAHKMEMALHFNIGLWVEGAVNVAPTGTNNRRTGGIIPWALISGLDRLNAATDPDYERTILFPDAAGSYSGANAGPSFSSVKYGSTLGGGNVAPAAVAPTPTALTRQLFKKNLLGNWYANDGQVGGAVIVVGSALRRTVSAFGAPITTGVEVQTITGSSAAVPAGTSRSSSATNLAIPLNYRTVPASERMLYDSVDAIVTDVGTVYICQDRYMDIDQNTTVKYGGGASVDGADATKAINFTYNPTTTILVMQRGYQKLKVLRPAHYTELAKVGDSDKGQMLCEWGLQVRHPKALAIATGFTENSG